MTDLFALPLAGREGWGSPGCRVLNAAERTLTPAPPHKGDGFSRSGSSNAR